MNTSIEWVRRVLPPTHVQIGDRVRTPARRWETVTGIDRGEPYAHATRIATDATGPDFPWSWVNRHRLTVLRARPVAVVATTG